MPKKIVWFVMAVACNVCFSKQNDELDFLVPNGAFDIRKTKVEGNGLEQLTYSIKTGYPSMAVSKKDLISQKRLGGRYAMRTKTRDGINILISKINTFLFQQ